MRFMPKMLDIDDDAFRSVQAYAESRSLSVGEAVAELLRRGISRSLRIRQEDGVHVVDLPHDSPKITTKQILDLEE